MDTDTDADHEYDTEFALDTVLEIVRGWDDEDLAAFLAEYHPGEVVAVGNAKRKYDEKSRRSECVE